MRYFLDFHRTLFNTEAFLAFLHEKTSVPGSAALSQSERSSAALAEYEAGRVTFGAGVLAQFVYGDVAEFLRLAANNATIVTRGAPALLQLKIQDALSHVPRVQVVYTGDKDKGPFVKQQLGESGSEAVFVDDTPAQLESVAASCPGVHLFEMRRDGQRGDGRWPVVTSLYELP